MSAIDTQNAKQIRDPMDVLIELDVRDDISMTYSGYSSTAKVSDGYLNKTYPMRKLADLQGDGFALDGTARLYKFLYPTQVNGKLGIRGNVGQSVDVTASSTSTIKALSLTVKNAASVTIGGTTISIVADQAVVQVNANSVTMTFNPADATHRIEVSAAVPGTVLTINNDNLIRAVVSLRSDLSLYGQTLPESELNVEVYNDSDISESVASIAEDVPITYQAGYPGDMSPVRKFYVSGQVTWKDNVLSIHAVDAVHFLDDIEMYSPVTEKYSYWFLNAVRYFLNRAGITPNIGTYYTGWTSDAFRWIIPKGTKARDFLAFMNQYFNITDRDGNLIDGSGELYDPLLFNYVDAGIPTLSTDPGHKNFTIYENDCADVQMQAEKPVANVLSKWEKILNPSMPVGDAYAQKIGTATFTKNVGATLNFDEISYRWIVGLYLGASGNDNDVAQKLIDYYGTVYALWRVTPVVPVTNYGEYSSGAFVHIDNPFVGDKLMVKDIPQSEYEPEGYTSFTRYYSIFVPWNQTYNGWKYDTNPNHLITTASQMWAVLSNAGVFDANSTVNDLDIYGMAINLQLETLDYSTGGYGISVDIGDAPIIGQIAALDDSNNAIEIYPSKMLQAPMYRSNVTGSFKWKGDPRMQPRDVGEFIRLDGTDEEITLENITLTHEGGGTSAEITYRKGVI